MVMKVISPMVRADSILLVAPMGAPRLRLNAIKKRMLSKLYSSPLVDAGPLSKSTVLRFCAAAWKAARSRKTVASALDAEQKQKRKRETNDRLRFVARRMGGVTSYGAGKSTPRRLRPQVFPAVSGSQIFISIPRRHPPIQAGIRRCV